MSNEESASPPSKPSNNNKKVVIKSSLSLRQRLVPASFRRKKQNTQVSSETGVSTVCSFEEHDEGDDEREEELDTARILTTRSGTEALLCPQKESRYLFEQGLQHAQQTKYLEAIESLTQALTLADGSELEPEILWTLISCYAQQEEEDEAGTYLAMFKPSLSKLQDEWIEREASLPMLSLLMEYRFWDTALIMSRFVETDDAVLARLHFETASNLTNAQEAVPQLEKALSYCHEPEDEYLKQSILQTLVQAHAAEEEWDEALSLQESYMISLQADGDADLHAQAHIDAAELHIAQGHYEKALVSLNEGLELVSNHVPLLQAKAHTLYKLGDTDQSLQVYKSLLPKVKHCPSDAAKIYYTMGRICCKVGSYEDALGHFQREGKVTRTALGKCHIENSRIYHDLARIHDEALGNYEQALKYYSKALKVEQRCLKKARFQVDRQELSSQILETQRCMGRIHYKQGEFGKAFTCSFSDDISI